MYQFLTRKKQKRGSRGLGPGRFGAVKVARVGARAPLRAKKDGRFLSDAPFGYNLFTNLRYNRVDTIGNTPGRVPGRDTKGKTTT